MNFDTAAEKYVALREEIKRIEGEAATQVAELRSVMNDLESWFTLRAEEEGLKTVNTSVGTAYWSQRNSATVASRDALFDHCKEHDDWGLVEARVSSTAVKSYIEGHGAPPPGVNFSSMRVFNLRKSAPKE